MRDLTYNVYAQSSPISKFSWVIRYRKTSGIAERDEIRILLSESFSLIVESRQTHIQRVALISDQLVVFESTIVEIEVWMLILTKKAN